MHRRRQLESPEESAHEADAQRRNAHSGDRDDTGGLNVSGSGGLGEGVGVAGLLGPVGGVSLAGTVVGADGAGVGDVEEVAGDDAACEASLGEHIEGVEADPGLGGGGECVEALLGDCGVVDEDKGVAVAQGFASGRVRADVLGEGGGVSAVLEEEDLAAVGGAAGGVEGGGLGGGGEAGLEPVEEGVCLAGGVGGDVEVDHEHGVGALQALAGC